MARAKKKRLEFLKIKDQHAQKMLENYETTRKNKEKKIEESKVFVLTKKRFGVILTGFKKNNTTKPIKRAKTFGVLPEKNVWKPLLMKQHRRDDAEGYFITSNVKRNWGKEKSRLMITNGPENAQRRKVMIYPTIEFCYASSCSYDDPKEIQNIFNEEKIRKNEAREIFI